MNAYYSGMLAYFLSSPLVALKKHNTAIMNNRELFKDKVVLDVGTGSGILAIWAAKAGAARVYAIEYTDMAKHARALVAHNNVADIVQVMQVNSHLLQPHSIPQ